MNRAFGKTFVGLMLIERFVMHEGKRVVLFAPKAAREDVWEPVIERYLPDLNSSFVNFIAYNHTDLQRKGKWQRDISCTLRDADVVLIDEAHHFHNPGIKGEGEREASRSNTALSTYENPLVGASVDSQLATASSVVSALNTLRVEYRSPGGFFYRCAGAGHRAKRRASPATAHPDASA